MRLLFVDDEPLILSGIENALIFASDEWDADFANSGEEALEMMEANRYDVLVTDMKMPGLTGADVLEYTKNSHPDVVRIVLSGEVDPKLAERAMPLLHEFVSKPCDPDDLFAVIERIYSTSRSLEEGTVRDVLGSLDHLPSQPALHARIQEALQRDEGVDAIARVIEADLAIASSIVKTANSAFYGFRAPAQDVRDAVSRLGSETVTGIVLNAEVAAWASPEMTTLVENLNSHSAMIAAVVQKLVGADVDQASLAGLLHDVGVLVLITQFPDQYKSLQQVIAGGREPGEETEREIFGASHAEVGAYMLEMWNADTVVVDATRYHHRPGATDGDARRIIDAITAVELANNPDREPSPELDEALIERARQLVDDVAERTDAA